MKRVLSFLLAALLMASSIVSCGNNGGTIKETEASDTNAVETTAPATNAPETTAPAPSYDTSLIVENGVAKAHIVLPDGASRLEQTAAEELSYHIKLVTGADIATVNAAQPDSLPILIATPDTLPELETLFPEDLAWLRTLKETDENGKTRNWGDDGFAVRQHNGKIYIFGATAVGSLNGTYDFIEENLDVIWVGQTEAGIIYDEMPTVNAVKADYREKSPFTISSAYSYFENTFRQRNKQYVTEYPYGPDANVKDLVLQSPLYDPNIEEYWDTDENGNHLAPDASRSAYGEPAPETASKHVNFWSQLTVDAVAASVIAQLDAMNEADRPKYFNVCMEDNYSLSVYPEMTEPFEYAPGQFVYPTDSDYITTVYFTFINRVAQQVGEKYPDIYVNTLAYVWATASPRCELEKNVSVWFCPIFEDYTQESFAVGLAEVEAGEINNSSLEAKYLHDWMEQHPDTPKMIYNYYFCHYVQGLYERPLWTRLQNDFQYFAENGIIGTTHCGAGSEGDPYPHPYQPKKGTPEEFTYGDAYDMNLLTFWIYYKLLWNPYEDVDALIAEFCEKVYGDAAEHMMEYYAILRKGWDFGSNEIIPYEFNSKIKWNINSQYYYFNFLNIETDDGVMILEGLVDAITKAWDAADDKTKEFIRRPYEVFTGGWERFLP